MSDEEKVNHPKHYNSLGAKCSGCARPIECIDVIEVMPHNLGAAVKYIWRAGLKPGESATDDLKKAAWYIARELERRKGTAA